MYEKKSSKQLDEWNGRRSSTLGRVNTRLQREFQFQSQPILEFAVEERCPFFRFKVFHITDCMHFISAAFSRNLPSEMRRALLQGVLK